MTNEVTIFAFFLKADSTRFDTSKTFTSSFKENWVTKVRQEVGIPFAGVVLIDRDNWDAPQISKFDQNEIKRKDQLIRKGIRKTLIEFSIPKQAIEKSLNHSRVFGNPVTGLIVFAIPYNGNFSFPEEKSKSFIGKLFSRDKNVIRFVYTPAPDPLPQTVNISFRYSDMRQPEQIQTVVQQTARERHLEVLDLGWDVDDFFLTVRLREKNLHDELVKISIKTSADGQHHVELERSSDLTIAYWLMFTLKERLQSLIDRW